MTKAAALNGWIEKQVAMERCFNETSADMIITYFSKDICDILIIEE